MTPAQKRLRELEEKRSKDRGRMAELALVEELSDEQREELTKLEKAVPDFELQFRAAKRAAEEEEEEQRAAGAAARQPDDGEDRERRELRQKITMAGYLRAAVENRAADGAEKEYLEAVNIPLIGTRFGGPSFPLELLAPAAVEKRQTTDTDIVTTPRRWLDRLFAGTAAAGLGVTMESVPTGSASYPVTSAGASAAQRGRSEDAADATWRIGVTELAPTRNAVRLTFNIEDAARIPGLESALTRDLRMALTEGIDRAVFLGDASANENRADITGLNTATITERPITQANKILGPGTLEAFTGLVDGIHAMSLGDLNVVASVGAWRLWENSIINASADNMTLAAFLRKAGLMWMARGEIETDTADGDFAAFVGLKRGIEGAGVAAVWEAGELIRDPYSKAAGGEVALTLCYLWAFGLPRASNFARVAFDA